MIAKKKVIITGATGFVGSNLARRLLQDGHHLHLFAHPGYRPWRIEGIRAKVKIYEVDFYNSEALEKIVGMIRPDWIFHLAAYGAYPWQNDLDLMLQTNIIGTFNLVKACLRTGFEAFVNTGSSSEYGFKDYACPETECLEPNSHYAVTKASSTLFCSYIARNHNVHMATLRLYSVYGPYEEPKRFIPTLIVRGLNGELPPLVKAENARDFVYIEDVVEAYLLAARCPDQEYGAIYNVGAGIQISIKKAIEVASEAMNITKEPQWESMPDRSWDTNVWVSDSRKMRERLGWQPRYTFEEGFRKTLKWFQENPELLAMYRKK